MQNFEIIKFNELRLKGISTEMLINTSAEELESIMLEIDNHDEFSDFDNLKNLCLDLVRRLPFAIRILEHNFILRARKNEKRNGHLEIFGSKKQIDYNPNPKYWGRFNKNDESIFYGSIPMNYYKSNGSLTTILETSKEVTDPQNLTLEYFFTICRWLAVKPINVIQLTFYSSAEINNPSLIPVHDNYLRFLRESCSNNDFFKIIKFYNYFAIKAAKKDPSLKDYFISTAFFHAIREYYGDYVGILFSSSRTEYSGVNICFTKKITDEDYLKPDMVGMYRATRPSIEKKEYLIYPCSKAVEVDIAGNFFLRPVLHFEP